jgi:hypothetical protein
VNFRDNLTRLTDDRSLQLIVPSRLDERSHLAEIDKRIGTPNPPAVLFNLRPWNNFTLIHAIYFDRLRYYQSLGLRTVVILYDKLVLKLRHVHGARLGEMDVAVANLRRWINASGIAPSGNEIFLESELWEMFSEQILDRMSSIAHCPSSAHETPSTESISRVLDNLCELAYESILKVDFVLTGGIDVKDIWRRVRLDSMQSANLDPPCVLGVDLLRNADRTIAQTDGELITMDDYLA